jgi:hypothetical protein
MFMARENREKRVQFPLLSYRYIVEFLDYYLTIRNREEKEVLEQTKNDMRQVIATSTEESGTSRV